MQLPYQEVRSEGRKKDEVEINLHMKTKAGEIQDFKL